MTIVIGLKHEGDVYLASDGMVSAGDIVTTNRLNKQIEGCGIKIGFAGTVSLYNAIKYMIEVELKDQNIKLETEHDIYEIYKKIYKQSVENGVIVAGDRLDMSVIIITENARLFGLDGDGAIIEYNDYMTAGNGWGMALGALAATKITSPEKDLRKIMKEVFKKYLGTGGKIQISMYPGKKTKKALLTNLGKHVKKQASSHGAISNK